MFIAKRPPHRVATGDVLSPAVVNENNNYLLAAAQNVMDHRVVRWSSQYNFAINATTPITSATASAFLRRSVPPAASRTISGTGTITGISAAITAYYTATLPFTLTLYPGHANALTVTLPARDASKATVPYSVTELFNIELTGTQSTALLLAPSVGASITVFDVELGWAADRFSSGDLSGATTAPTVPVTLGDFTDATIASAATFSGLQTTVETLAQATRAGLPCRWACAEIFSVDSSSAVPMRRVPLGSFTSPSFAPCEYSPQIVGVWIDAEFTAIVGGVVSFGVADFSGAYTAKFVTVIPGAATLVSGMIVSSGVFKLTSDFAAQITVPATSSLLRATIYVIFQ